MRTPFHLVVSAILAIAVAGSVSAQERSAVYDPELMASVSSLRSKIDMLSIQLNAAEFTAGKIFACNSRGGTWAPTNPEADVDGCVSSFTTMENRTITASVCKSDDNVYTKNVTCPTGYQLLGCSGGSGALYTGGEGYFVRPDDANGCQLVVGKPRCISSHYWTYARVFAFCARTVKK